MCALEYYLCLHVCLSAPSLTMKGPAGSGSCSGTSVTRPDHWCSGFLLLEKQFPLLAFFSLYTYSKTVVLRSHVVRCPQFYTLFVWYQPRVIKDTFQILHCPRFCIVFSWSSQNCNNWGFILCVYLFSMEDDL